GPLVVGGRRPASLARAPPPGGGGGGVCGGARPPRPRRGEGRGDRPPSDPAPPPRAARRPRETSGRYGCGTGRAARGATPLPRDGRAASGRAPRSGAWCMTCPACGHENRPVAKFCENCAAPISRLCASCGSELRQTAKFCDECGAEIQGLGVSGKNETLTPNPLAPSPRSYTPKHLAGKILQSKCALEGERKQVTVLFADVKGSMELEEQLDPEEWSQIMNRFFTLLADGVERFEGFV